MNRPTPRIEYIPGPGPDVANERIVHRAGWVLINPFQMVENGCVEVENGLITDVYRACGAGIEKTAMGLKTIDHGPGVIMPCLVNAHCHLELSALKNSLSFDRGFSAWVQDLLEKREAAGEAALLREAQRAANQLFDQGTGFIGEISTLGLTGKMLRDLNLSGVWFQEFLGACSPKTVIEKQDPLSISLAGHAPHTTDPFLLQTVKKQTRDLGLPFSIHLAESDAESEFISGKRGGWGDFLAARGIDTAGWPIGSKSPVQYLDDLGVLDSFTLGVHLLNIDDRDLEILARTRTRICLCPRSNYNLHKRLPDIGKMLGKKLAPALGSDSLASCDSLSIFDEMAFVRRKYPRIEPGQILSMATINGARALGLEHRTGTLDKGKKSAFIYVDINVRNKSELIESLTTHET